MEYELALFVTYHMTTAVMLVALIPSEFVLNITLTYMRTLVFFSFFHQHVLVSRFLITKLTRLCDSEERKGLWRVAVSWS